MSVLTQELQKICSEEGISFDDFLKKLRIRKRSLQKQAQAGDLFGETGK